MYCYNPTLVWRKDMWDLEKEWVENLAKNYSCELTKHDMLDSLHLTEFIEANNVSVSLINHIIKWAIKKRPEKDIPYKASEAVLIFEKYIRLTPLARDYRMYFAYYMGDDTEPEDCDFEEGHGYIRMGYSQEKLMRDGRYDMFSSWHYANMAKDNRGEEGIWGWYADSKFPSMQKDIVSFMCANWGIWCPYDDVDKMAEQYLFFHYPGDEDLKGTVYGDLYVENFVLREETETAAIDVLHRALKKDYDIELYKMYDDCCYYRPILCYNDEKEYDYPLLIKIGYDRYEASILCSEESKVIDDEIKAYKRKFNIGCCFFYKGEDENPFKMDDWKHHQWEYEKLWVCNVAGDSIREQNYIGAFLMDFPDGFAFDPRPLSYKAFVYCYLTCWNAGYPSEKQSYRKSAEEVYNLIVKYQKRIKR